MALTLELAQTVALGPFNPFIITPEWLVRTEILPRDGEIRFGLVSEGAGFEFLGVRWEIDLSRLVVSSTKYDCGDLVAKVLDQLLHTPVRGVGNNFQFTCDPDSWGQGPLPTLGGKSQVELAKLVPLEQTRWSGVFRREDVRIDVTLVSGNEILTVLINHHRDTDPRNYKTAIAAARQFVHDRKVSEELLRSLLSQEVKT